MKKKLLTIANLMSIQNDTGIYLSKRCNGYIGIINACEVVWQHYGLHDGLLVKQCGVSPG